jgi:hypothetical protein
MFIIGTLLRIGFQFDYVFDWTILKYQQSQIATVPPRAVVSPFRNSAIPNDPPSEHIIFLTIFLTYVAGP